MKRLLYFIVVILLIALIVISSYFIYKQLREEKEQESIFDDLHEIIQDNDENSSKDNLNANNDINLNELYNQNNDLIGWIKIDNTTIDYPVMQTKYNPEYYLKRNFYKEYSSYGTPFLAGECNLETSENLIIYGHHMQNSKMFGTLENYKSKEYYDNHKIINFYTLDDVEKYEIFAVFKTTLYQSNTFKYYQNIELDTEEDYLNFINQCCSLSFYNTNIIPEYKDKLITLSTCEYSAKNSRLVVVARQITN
jgi:sortase B